MAKTYLSLGDSMSIDDYTGVEGGGAVRQLHALLPGDWTLVDRTFDGCTIPLVPLDGLGNLITLTIGGNDLLSEMGWVLQSDLSAIRPADITLLEDNIRRIAERHSDLVRAIRTKNPEATFVVGNVYAPQFPLPPMLAQLLDGMNARIAENVRSVNARLADIRAAFRGNEDRLLCMDIEPNHEGATAIARLFLDASK
jgi:lysophospholipase L1-like esterase